VVGLVRRRLHPTTTKLITYAHGEELLIARTSRQLIAMARHVLAWSDLVIANSENTRRMVRALSPTARVACIHPGVDVASYRLDRHSIDAYRHQLGWSPETILLCTVARMERRKNHAMVIRALAKLRAEGVTAAYVCAGDGPEAAALRELVRELGLEQFVRLPGAIGELDKRLLLAAADIHLMPAVQVGEMIEGFGIVFLEAAAAGTPSIAGRNGGQSEAVKHRVTGLVIDGTQLSEVMDAIRLLAADSALRRRMGTEGRKWAGENDWEAVTDKTVRALSTIR
jgi:phosphatidylinositol alpha-1,6-mannosyltransferase